MKSLAQLLLEIEPDASDRKIATLIGDRMTENERVPYIFSIQHDIRPPKNLRCPVRYDWALKDRVGIHTTDKPTARRWITEACLHGFSVTSDGVYPLTFSIAIARRRAEFHQHPPVYDDGDIPF